MTESPIFNEWLEKACSQSEMRAVRRNLLTLLDGRFPGAVPTDVIATINEQPDLKMLDDWFRQAVTVPSIDDFRAYLRR